jgi:hypothetical protein
MDTEIRSQNFLWRLYVRRLFILNVELVISHLKGRIHLTGFAFLIFNGFWDICNNDNPTSGCAYCKLSKLERSRDGRINFVDGLVLQLRLRLRVL